MSPERTPRSGPARAKPSRLLRRLGPGLISGASDDDPTAIATYSQAGATFGFALCWLPLLCYPIMVIVEEVSARIGRTTGRGIAANIGRRYPSWVLLTGVLLLICANIIEIGADLGAMADVVRLLVGGPRMLYVVCFGTLCVAMQVFMRYRRYVAILKWTTMSLLSYVAALALAGVDWSDAARGFVPSVSWSREWIVATVGIFGAAISPYVFFWQSAQEAEDLSVSPEREPLVAAREQAPSALSRIRLDTYVGMAVAMLVGLAIIITTGASLHAKGITDIQTSAEAAEALRPIAGPFATIVFALGIVGTGLLAVPVLGGSAAYAIGEARRWPVGLARRPMEAKAFYATLALATIIGMAINASGIDPLQALYGSAVINGVVAAPAIALMMLLAGDRRVMGEFTIGLGLRVGGWVAAAILVVSTAALLASPLLG